MPQCPEGVMSQQGQCQIWKRETWQARRHHVALRLCACTSGLYTVSQPRPRGLEMQIVNHMLPFMSLSLLSLLSVYLECSKMDKVLGEQREHWYPQYDDYCSEQLWKCQTGLRWEKCRAWNETADTSFPFIPSSDATFVTECFIYVWVLSLLTCAFHPTSTIETQHMLSRKRLLVSHLFCRGSMLFVWTCTVCSSPNRIFRGSTEEDAFIQTGWRLFCMSVLWLLSLLTILFFPET